MGTQQRNLSIVFRGIQPEMLFQSICDNQTWSNVGTKISVAKIDLRAFQGIASTQYPVYSYEEIENIYRLMSEDMQPISKSLTTSPSVFYLLVRMGKRVFEETRGQLVCKFSNLLAWQNVYQKLGQDLFTTAFLAYEDIERGRPPRTEFTWDAVLKTDNGRLNNLLRSGIAENHCHLGGTTQNFPLSWACVMNYPNTISLAAGQIKDNLQANTSRGVGWNVWSWEKRLIWASFLRLELFKRLEGSALAANSLNMEEECFYPMLHVKKELSYLKPCYAAQVPQKDGSTFVIDYALRSIDCKEGLLKNHNRLLSGERSFLYRCFRACFDGSFDEQTQNWFYMYLLLKENFRAEIIQVNHQPGFKNFKDYQDRKDGIYDAISGYHAEAVRLSVNANQQKQNILSFEARIAPKKSAVEMWRQIRGYEEQIEYAKGIPEGHQRFYVYHFIKSPDSRRKMDKPRNYTVRTDSKQRAKALGYALQHSTDFCNHVWGIDAANIEIGCRPETFATEFRYLKDIKSLQRRKGFLDLSTQPHIYATYHAGEDFLDVVDGIRAIDEAVKFLHLSRGDRIGHALALGVDPDVHYNYKNRKVVLPKQDFLDNIVWLLYRSEELGVDINPRLRSTLNTKACHYLFDIYGSSSGLHEYYCSMQLRGDAPELYYVIPYEKPVHLRSNSYDQYKEDSRKGLDSYRESKAISGIYQRYHYDKKVREEGSKVIEFSVDQDYIDLVRIVQDGLAAEIRDKGIMIECNPTSNYLIGTFRRYDAHPIFRFNNVGLVRADGTYEPSMQLSVSINTDDLGVFDTSLENEYAILAASLHRLECGKTMKYTNDSIYSYLENIRKMGLEQSFLLSHFDDAPNRQWFALNDKKRRNSFFTNE